MVKTIEIEKIRQVLPKDCAFEVCTGQMTYIDVKTAREIDREELMVLNFKFNTTVYNNIVVIRQGIDPKKHFRFYFNLEGGERIIFRK